jgi:putative transposase
LECELLDRRRFATKAEAWMAVVAFIEGWYNPRRRHSALVYASPLEYEQQHLAAAELSSPQLSAEGGNSSHAPVAVGSAQFRPQKLTVSESVPYWVRSGLWLSVDSLR